MDSWIGLLLCCGAYFVALMFIWAFFIGATRGNLTEEEWLELHLGTGREDVLPN